jgi:hypothetical protein
MASRHAGHDAQTTWWSSYSSGVEFYLLRYNAL